MFMKNILNIPDVKRRFVQDKFGLLKDILRSHLLRLPFQGITSFGSVKVTANGRPSPTLRTIISANIRGMGGLCVHNNYFLRLQLESIGYNVETVTGCFRRTGLADSHVMTVVKVNPTRKSDVESFLVDAGCGIPLHEPIPLNHLPFRGRAGGLNYRYERIDDNNIQRVNENGDALIGEKPEGFLSPQDYTIKLRSTTLSEILPTVHHLYSSPRSLYLHQGMYCFRYLSIDDDDFKMVCIRGTELMLITKETRVTQSFKDYYELQPFILKYFPMIDPIEVGRAVENYSQPSIHTQKIHAN